MLPCFWDHVTAVIVNQRYFVFKKIQRWIKFDFPQYLGSCTFSRQLLDWILYSPMADTIRHPSYKPPAKEDMYLPPRTIENREIKSHIYGKQQTSHISWEFLRTENKHIKPSGTILVDKTGLRNNKQNRVSQKFVSLLHKSVFQYDWTW